MSIDNRQATSLKLPIILRMKRNNLKINIRRLKEFVRKEIPKHCVLRNLILSDKDEMDVHEFLVKIDYWLKLLRG